MNPSVFIGIPSGSDWKSDFGMSLASLMAAINKPLKGGHYIERVQLWNTKGSILSRSRHALVMKALELKCSHILFVDSDMVFPNFTLHQLLASDKAVIGANCVVKSVPSNPTARLKGEQLHGVTVDSREAHGLQQVWRLGTGVLLIKLSVFSDLAKPWFNIPWNEELQDYTGEDWTLCARLEEAGIPIWIDHDLSKHIGHIGSYTYTQADIGE
jgi:hypothetical protein